jgi:hypothetical protein
MAENVKRQKRILLTIILLILATPLILWLAWNLRPERKLVLAIIDKTVLTSDGQEHISLDWILNQEKFRKNNLQPYTPGHDYFGFFPLRNEKFQIKGLERFTDAQIQTLSNDVDGAYVTDTYGIYQNEWFKENDEKERSGIIYGAMSSQDLFLLKQLQAQHKLIIGEFNCIGTPTSGYVRSGFQESFGVRWTGWVGRYFDSFDTTVNLELPKWLVRQYKDQHNGIWPFKKSGIAYVNVDETVVVLENETHLDKEFPIIIASSMAQDYYGLPDKLKYSYWFDVTVPDSSKNQVIANFQIGANSNGIKELQHYGLPLEFPAITMHKGADYQFFYFSADFCDNPITLTTSYFRWVDLFKWLYYNTKEDPAERKSFFWKIYRPLMTRILNDYYSTLKR